MVGCRGAFSCSSCCCEYTVRIQTHTITPSITFTFITLQDRHLLAIVSELTEGDNSDNDDDEDDDDDSSGADNKPRPTTRNPNSARDIPWAIVAQRLGTYRTSADCMKRYNKLTGQRQSEKTAALKGPWTADEDHKIMALVSAHGAKRWSQIAAELPGEFSYKHGKIRHCAYFQIAQQSFRSHWKTVS